MHSHPSRDRPPARPAAVAALLAALLAAPAAASSQGTLQPGDLVESYEGWPCTLNFVFDGPSDAYIGTAGHCVDTSVQERASNADLGEFGTFVYDNDALDFALVDVDDPLEGLLSADVDGHPGTPTGVATPADTDQGDRLLLSGYGLGVSATEPTREQRPSVLVEHTATQYRSDGPVVYGDSGAPFVHAETGKALGIVSKYGVLGVPPTTDVGPTLDHILDVLHDDGWDVQLRTAS